jgi:hypothetical protein
LPTPTSQASRWNDYHQVVDRREFPRVQQLFERLQDDAGVQFAHAIKRNVSNQQRWIPRRGAAGRRA